MEKSVHELLDLSNVLVKEYADDISDELRYQLMLLKSTLRVKLTDVKTIRALAEFLLIKHSELSSTFSEVITACLLYLTLPVTVASADRSFSKLKIIKTYLRSTMCQVRLSSLGILSIESQRLNNLNADYYRQFCRCKVSSKALLKIIQIASNNAKNILVFKLFLN